MREQLAHRKPAFSCILLAWLLFTLMGVPASGQSCGGFKVLIYSKTTGFRHAAQITAGISLIQSLGSANGFSVDATEDQTLFTPGNLAQYAVVIFLNTTGNILNLTQEAAFQGYIMNGGGFVGVHSASDTEYTWPFYGFLMGAYFQSHPAIQPADVHVADPNHPSTASLSAVISHSDEWYDFQTNPANSPAINVLLTLDETSYTGGTMGAVHPIAWYQEIAGVGRSFYTGLGHTMSTYSLPYFQVHLLGGILYASGAIRTATISAVQAYGAGSGTPVLNLTGSIAPPSTALISLSAADPNGAGLLFVSTCSDSLLAWPYTILIDLSPTHLLTYIPISFNAAGQFQLPLPLDLTMPAFLGTSLSFQVAQVAPTLGLSNGLELVLTP